MSQTSKTYLILSLIAVIGLALFGYFFIGGVFGGTTIGVSITTNPDLERGLVGHWTFDGGDINTTNGIVDRSGQGNHGQFIGGATTSAAVEGRIGQALDFDGTDDNVLAITDGNINDDVSFSFAFWYQTSTGSFETVGGTKISAADAGWLVNINGDHRQFSDNMVTFWPAQSTGNAYNFVDSSIDNGEWHHITVTLSENGVTTNVAMYYDGVLKTTGSHAENEKDGGDFDIGSAYTQIAGTDTFFDGKLDDVRLYNRSISAEEVQRLYDLGATTKINVTLNTNPDLESGLVGHWTFDGGDINTTNGIVDRSGQGNHGQFKNSATTSASVEGRIGQALEFDGVDDYIELTGTRDGLDESGPYTISLWYKSVASTTETILISTKQSNGTGFFMCLNCNGIVTSVDDQLAIWWGISTTRKLLFEDPMTDDGNWHHVVFASDGSGGGLYFDSDLKASEDVDNQGDNIQTNMFIGTSTYLSSVSKFEGSIDDVRIYNRTLSPNEIKRLYDLGATTKVSKTITTNPDLERGLVGHWTFDGGDINTTNGIVDRSGQGNHGQFNGGATTTAAVEGRIGQALDFDGIDDYVDVGNILDESNTYSITLWYKAADVPGSSFDTMLGTKDNTGAREGFALFFDRSPVDPNTENTIVFWPGGNTNQTVSFTDSSIDDNNWHNIVVIYDHSTSKASIYYDGVIKQEGAITDNFNNSAHNLFLGRNGNIGYVDNPFDGLIDDVRIYNRALSSDEIKRLYDLGR